MYCHPAIHSTIHILVHEWCYDGHRRCCHHLLLNQINFLIGLLVHHHLLFNQINFLADAKFSGVWCKKQFRGLSNPTLHRDQHLKLSNIQNVQNVFINCFFLKPSGQHLNICFSICIWMCICICTCIFIWISHTTDNDEQHVCLTCIHVKFGCILISHWHSPHQLHQLSSSCGGGEETSKRFKCICRVS